MRSRRQTFIDLGVVIGVTVVAGVIIAVDASLGPLRILAGLVLVLFAPGYAFVSAIYPETGAGRRGPDRVHSPDGLDRVAMAVLFSVCLVGLLALGVNYTPASVSRLPVLLVVIGWTVFMSVVAAIRRLRLPREHRFGVDIGAWVEAGDSFLRKRPASLRSTSPFEPENDTEYLLNVLVVLGVAALVVSMAFAAVADPGGESFTELYLLTENEDGELVAEGFESSSDGGESIPLTVAVGNHEGTTQTYQVVVLLQRTTDDGSVESQDTLEAFELTVEDGETTETELSVTPSMAGEDLRLSVLLYQDAVPDDPHAENAYRDVHVHVSVS